MLDRALAVSAIVHRTQARKGTLVPYVVHPFHVAVILQRHGFGAALVAAGVLHDVLEDVEPADPEVRRALRETFPERMGSAPEAPAAFLSHFRGFLAAEFGAEVASLVEAVTRQKTTADGRPVPPGEARRSTIEELARPGTPGDVLALKSADVLHNVSSLERDLRQHGLRTLDRFGTTPGEALRYYWRVAELAMNRFGAQHPLAQDLSAAVQALALALSEADGQAHQSILDAVREVARDSRA